jgi:sugar O-acyltransferase (sialic acid O-acetyltransferase NeuD family)
MGYAIIGYADKSESSFNPYKLSYLGDEANNKFDWERSRNYILAVGDNGIRQKLALRVAQNGGNCLTIIHPDASISKDSTIGSGTFVARGVAINPLVRIGMNAIVNTNSSIDHECQIGDNVHIAPGAVLAGNISVGNEAFIGANAVVKQGVRLGDKAVIGAGAVILKDVHSDSISVGNPAREIR